MYKLLSAILEASGCEEGLCMCRKGTMWYLMDTFLQPRTDRCWSVCIRGCTTFEINAMPPMAVLSRSRLLKRVATGITTCISNESKACCLLCLSLESAMSMPGDVRLMAACGSRKLKARHASGYSLRKDWRLLLVW